MTAKRFENRLNKDIKKFNVLNPVWDNEKKDGLNIFEMIDLLNELYEENQALKERNKKLYTEIFEMRTNIALERTEINRETYTAKKSAKEFLDELEKW